VLITVLPVNKIPSVEQYQREILTYLKNQKATHGTLSSAEVLSEASCRMVRFHLDAELGNEKIMLHYGIASHKLGGATIAARVPSRSASELTPEVLTILQGLTFMKSSGQ
jgi:hypothetical protein